MLHKNREYDRIAGIETLFHIDVKGLSLYMRRKRAKGRRARSIGRLHNETECKLRLPYGHVYSLFLLAGFRQ